MAFFGRKYIFTDDKTFGPPFYLHSEANFLLEGFFLGLWRLSDDKAGRVVYAI